ncbi:MAG: hypothetical protein GQF41_0073 [Candidatus Rifleibacterium amylolyticum]|nr:MAG: hypothetical protein GQF41_0073 [Candidatus Rifleibacterium amylolyticum]
MRKLLISQMLVFILVLSAAMLNAAPEYVYIAATNVRMRDAATTSGKAVATLPIGTWCKVVAESDKAETLLGKTSRWFKVITGEQQEGWVFGGLTLSTSNDDRISTAIQIIDAQIKAEKKSVEDLMQTLDFADKTREMASHSLEKAHLETAFLRMLSRIYDVLSMEGKGSDSKHPAVKNHQNLCYYHEPAGQYFVKSDAYWELAEKYSDIVEAAEDIAWQAAKQPLPGESEGDPDMMIYFFENSYGRYVESFPEGAHVAEALDMATGILDHAAENLSYYETAEEKSQLKTKLAWFEDLAKLTPESEARKKLLASRKKVLDRLGN